GGRTLSHGPARALEPIPHAPADGDVHHDQLVDPRPTDHKGGRVSTRPRPTRPMRKPVSSTPSWVAPVAVVAAIALLVAAFLLIRWYTPPLPLPPLTVDATQQVITSITSLPASELDAAGTGSANNLVKKVSGSPLTGPNGHPEVFYMGAEYCPYCAAERWPMIVA